MPKSNVLSGGMKVFFSLLLAFFFTSGCTIFPFVPLKRLSLGSWFCRTLLFFGIARIIPTHSLLHKKFLYFETKLFITGTNPLLNLTQLHITLFTYVFLRLGLVPLLLFFINLLFFETMILKSTSSVSIANISTFKQ